MLCIIFSLSDKRNHFCFIKLMYPKNAAGIFSITSRFAARKYDIEAWIPTQNKYREMTSTSTVTDFQSRRLNMKYQDGDEKKYLQVLNGTVFSTRPLVAIIENYQQEDGSVVIPEVLRKYIGKDIITPR